MQIYLFFRLGNYRIYRIKEKKNNETIIKCERRYNQFDKFYNRIIRNYPWVIIPELVEKLKLDKFVTLDENNYRKRQIHLNYFLKYISEHEDIKETKEFNKFIRDTNFDEDYFIEDKGFFLANNFPESYKNKDGYLNMVMDRISSSFSNNNSNEFVVHSNLLINVKDYLSKKEFYELQLKNFKFLKKYYVIIILFYIILFFLFINLSLNIFQM